MTSLCTCLDTCTTAVIGPIGKASVNPENPMQQITEAYDVKATDATGGRIAARNIKQCLYDQHQCVSGQQYPMSFVHI